MMKSYPLKCLLVIVLLYKCGFISCQDIVGKTNKICESNVQCPANGFCKILDDGKGLCTCNENYVIYNPFYSSTQSECLRVATKVGDPCETHDQCSEKLEGTFCLYQKCDCIEGYHIENGECRITRIPGRRCDHDQECLTNEKEQGQCIEGICFCDECDLYRNTSSILKSNIAIISILILLLTIFREESRFSI